MVCLRLRWGLTYSGISSQAISWGVGMKDVPCAGRNGAYVIRKSRTNSVLQFELRLAKFSIPVKNSLAIRFAVTSFVFAIMSGWVRKRAVVCWMSPSGAVRLNAMSMVAYHFMEMCVRMAASRRCRTSSMLLLTYSWTSTSVGSAAYCRVFTVPRNAYLPMLRRPANHKTIVYNNKEESDSGIWKKIQHMHTSLNEPYSHLLVMVRASLTAAVAVDECALDDVTKTQIISHYCQMTIRLLQCRNANEKESEFINAPDCSWRCDGDDNDDVNDGAVTSDTGSENNTLHLGNFRNNCTSFTIKL